MALDEATAGLLAQMAASGIKPLEECTPQEARQILAPLREFYGTGPEMARVEEARVDDAFPVRVLVPPGTVRGVVVYFHGGGWVLGDLDEFDALGRNIARSSGCAVVLVDYRLAPEHRYPAAADDAYAALCWTEKRLADIAGDRVPLIVAGDSAGGNLAAVTALRARDRGGPEIALQVLVYPVLDHDVDTASYVDPANQLLLTREGMIWFWNHYAPSPADRDRPDASPLHAEDLSGLPPAVVLTAEHDVLRDENDAYVERLREAGVAVRHRRFQGQMHGFFSMVNLLPASAEGVDHVAAEIGRAI